MISAQEAAGDGERRRLMRLYQHLRDPADHPEGRWRRSEKAFKDSEAVNRR